VKGKTERLGKLSFSREGVGTENAEQWGRGFGGELVHPGRGYPNQILESKKQRTGN